MLSFRGEEWGEEFLILFYLCIFANYREYLQLKTTLHLIVLKYEVHIKTVKYSGK